MSPDRIEAERGAEQGAERRHAVRSWLVNFGAALTSADGERLAGLFVDESYWRDVLSCTWDIKTVQGAKEIASGLLDREATSLTGLALDDRDPTVSALSADGAVIEAFFTFRTATGSGRGLVRLKASVAEPATYRAWTLLTTLHELADYPPRIGRARPRPPSHQPERGLLNWLDQRVDESGFVDRDPAVLIIGAGQAGLTVAARLGQLDVSALVVDRIAHVGDNWRHRYHSLRLHNELSVNHMPYLPFPQTWPVFIPKDMLADWFEFYVKALELNVWTGTEFLGGEYDEQQRRWQVRLRLADGTVRVMRPQQVVMAIGISGVPSIPELAGRDEFTGQLVHSSEYGVDLDVHGKRALVIGAGNSGHDIAQDLYLRGAEVTMVQRSSTTVVSVEPSAARVYSTYIENEDRVPLEDLDLMSASVPNALLKRLHVALSRQMQEDDRELLDGLERAGFLLDNGEDDTGFFIKSQRYFGRYYLNVGASDLIVAGKIGVKSGQGIAHIGRREVVLTDGTSLPADVIVLATGYKPLQEGVRRLFGDVVAEKVGPIWGFADDDELRNMWKRTNQPGLFVAGGSFAQSRIYSRYVALQIKAALTGMIDY